VSVATHVQAEPAPRPAPWQPIVGAALVVLAEIWAISSSRIAHQRAFSLPVIDLSRTADRIGLLFALPFLVGLAVMLARRHKLPASRAWWTLGAALFCLLLLPIAPLLDPGSRAAPSVPFGYALFLLAHLVWLGLLRQFLHRRPLRGISTAMRILRNSIVTTILIFLVTIISVLVSPFGEGITQTPRGTADAGVVLGAAVWSGDKPSPVLRERVRRAWELLSENRVRFVVLTGGHAPNEKSEAEVARRLLMEMGADPTRLVKEERSGSTLDQILYIRDTLQPTQDWHSFIIVSDQFHLKRALEICEFNRISAQGVSSDSPLSPASLIFYHLRESAALILYWLFGI